ncbi:nucleoside triphosphate pyrophosphohydrolase [Telmatospirillum siberiense]|uniref:Nucleoside triphosphate pyrophosphohydrolase n=1 Tax=Telmatospirillum siberiense TaxID=382514 RepID=A0A2N3PZ11_9PROT|nr:nucleoside triphosphate pyrophosphohydrolase [Telmatospirillum siberiense]PKU25619.1 nucleoside triphosphate pyrophosphohydrolase [Telmatospirillum siberiense]
MSSSEHFPHSSQSAIDRLLSIMARLRAPEGGCPWDIAQTFKTIAQHTIEEAYEVVEAIEADDKTALKDELGDLLFQVVFYAQMAREEGSFDFEDVVGAICDKMERRHPHVFADASIADARAQTAQWEAQKARERQRKAGEAPQSALAGVSTALPAQTRALKLQARAGRVGFDWPEAEQVLDKIAEEIGEVRAELGETVDRDRLEDEVGDLLFACVNLARKLEIDPETALRRGNRKFERRFHHIEAELAKRGRTPGESSLAEMEAFWVEAKKLERGEP